MNDFPLAHPLLQPLPGGRFLVVGGRCAWRAEGPEKNALLIGQSGQVVRSGTVGDGIQHMLVDDAGDVWIGYIDEGTSGTFGWGGPGPTPLGSAGIVHWSTRFEKLWEYQAVDRYWIDDCYVLNVDRHRVWTCPYTDFPLLQIYAGNATVHPTTTVSGPRGLIVAGTNVAFLGNYDSGSSLLLGALDNLSRFTTGKLVLPDGRRAPVGRLTCRGSVANLFIGADWFTFDLAEIL